MSQLGVILQESLGTERERRTILGLLTEQMEAVDNREPRRRRSLKERLRFTGMGCCGATWGFRPTAERHGGEIENDDDEDERRQQQRRLRANPGQGSSSSDPDCVAPISAGSGMNLAAALAAERQFRGAQEAEEGSEGSGGGGRRTTASAAPETPWRVSLMRLLEETEGGGDSEVRPTATETEKGGVGNDTVCCVCMGRKKGAAFIPCGHTFCRVCSRELWLNRGTCPLCNRSILEILDIF